MEKVKVLLVTSTEEFISAMSNLKDNGYHWDQETELTESLISIKLKVKPVLIFVYPNKKLRYDTLDIPHSDMMDYDLSELTKFINENNN